MQYFICCFCDKTWFISGKSRIFAKVELRVALRQIDVVWLKESGLSLLTGPRLGLWEKQQL